MFPNLPSWLFAPDPLDCGGRRQLEENWLKMSRIISSALPPLQLFPPPLAAPPLPLASTMTRKPSASNIGIIRL